MRALALVLACTAACAGLKPTPPTVPESKRAETKELPPDPETEKLEGVPDGDWIKPLEAGACVDINGKLVPDYTVPCPVLSGILMSEAKAARFGLYKVRYVELRKGYEADRAVWAAQRELYETRLKLADQEIQELQPGWWDKNKLSVGVIGGFILGTALTVAIFSVTD